MFCFSAKYSFETVVQNIVGDVVRKFNIIDINSCTLIQSPFSTLPNPNTTYR